MCPLLPFSDYLLKLLLIGDTGVGKSSLLLRFAVSKPVLTNFSVARKCSLIRNLVFLWVGAPNAFS